MEETKIATSKKKNKSGGFQSFGMFSQELIMQLKKPVRLRSTRELLLEKHQNKSFT